MTSNQQSAVEMREALEILLFRATQHEGFAAPEANYRAIEAATSALAKSRLNTDDAVDEEVVALEWLSRNPRMAVEHYSPVYCDDDDQSVEWRVTEQRGSINDREYETVGRGETPLAAIVSAMGKKS